MGFPTQPSGRLNPQRQANDAHISPDGRYRYVLTRDLRHEVVRNALDLADDETAPPELGKGRLLFIMLNPSTADAQTNDPTIRRCMGFGLAWGFDHLCVVNLFAHRATNPKALRGHPLALLQGPQWRIHVQAAIQRSNLIVCAWGGQVETIPRGREAVKAVRDEIAAAGKEPFCLDLTTGGHPRHPLYMNKGAAPRRW